MAVNKVKGTYDVLPSESYLWQALENQIREVLGQYNFKEIRTPIMEYSEVFHRHTELSDMVTKETYDFDDRGDRKLTLRPEGTAGVIRSYVENKLYTSQELEKVYYIGPNFRYERPQKGRYRQFYQFGVEAIGTVDSALDAEMIILAYDFMKRLGLKGVRVKINSLGDEESRQNYRKALEDHFQPHVHELCSDCQQRITKNPLRILDCKVDQKHKAVKEAPTPQDYLNEVSRAYFQKVLQHLNAAKISYEIAHKLVRGLDYYSHTVFEIEADIEGFGAQNALGGGGRYQKLVSELGGPDLGGIGFACGMERLLLALEAENVAFAKESELDAYVIVFSEDLKVVATKILYELRVSGVKADMNYTQKSFKAQLKQALKMNSKYLIILGDDEYQKGVVGIKNTKTEKQEEVVISKIKKYMTEKLEKK
ncbi:histidine--tRNA ligase [Peloplasma aerotolerans]|uniref:Histidine--tRNA ligase n=1 Tax=Peloplasma aerotolerans TaxID=3044389 RepID=A0AAW6UAS6_9MOLU|nr:histidine--tRNA ligase [Mariniplasma sp. M4Ah]MDI6452038.1 histidine--tRNA ligase [Mariniplasma sp. M4Ah]MDR4968503.1 histidine--tRNA ligase [Acholeplasmataceae bacterium]